MSLFEEKVVNISEIEVLLNNGYFVEVESPDGFVPVSAFVDKGDWPEYILSTASGKTVRCNSDHLFETPFGWKKSAAMVGIPDAKVLTADGWQDCFVVKTKNKIPIVDIQVEHKNHRYYTEGVSSHNTGVGKSLFMCHVAAGCMSQGKNVLYITMEMAEERIAERIDANLLDVTVDSLVELPKDMFDRKIARLREKTTGKLIIKEYPTASASSIHFRTLLNELNLKKSFVPDIIFIDYLNICCSARIKAGANINSYTYVKSIAEELRGLAVEFGVPIVSATQTTRSGFSSSDPGLEDTSESFGLPATADLMFALISSEELEEVGQIMVKQLKNRYNDPTYFKRFTLGIDRSKMKLYDIAQTENDYVADSGHKGEDKPLNTFGTRDRKDFGGFKV